VAVFADGLGALTVALVSCSASSSRPHKQKGRCSPTPTLERTNERDLLDLALYLKGQVVGSRPVPRSGALLGTGSEERRAREIFIIKLQVIDSTRDGRETFCFDNENENVLNTEHVSEAVVRKLERQPRLGHPPRDSGHRLTGKQAN